MAQDTGGGFNWTQGLFGLADTYIRAKASPGSLQAPLVTEHGQVVPRGEAAVGGGSPLFLIGLGVVAVVLVLTLSKN